MHRCPSPLAVVVSLAIFADHPDCPKAVLHDAADRMAAGLIRGYIARLVVVFLGTTTFHFHSKGRP